MKANFIEIEQTSYEYGITYLNTETFDFYFILAAKFVPDEEQRKIIEERYNNNIADNVNFLYINLVNRQDKVINEGWGLKLLGTKASKERELPFRNGKMHWTKYIECLFKIIGMRNVEDLEKVISIYVDVENEFYKSDFSMSTNWGAMLYLRQLLDKGTEYQKYVYYHIDEDKNFDDEIKLTDLQESTLVEDAKIIPYTKELWEEIEELTKRQHEYVNMLDRFVDGNKIEMM